EDADGRPRRGQPDRFQADDGRHDEVPKRAPPEMTRHRPRLVSSEPSSDLARRLSTRGRRVIHVGPPSKVPASPGVLPTPPGPLSVYRFKLACWRSTVNRFKLKV